ncbi:MAG: amidase family protein, partial [Bacteroidota bacterium]
MNRAIILSLLLAISLGCQQPASVSNPNDFDFLEASIIEIQTQFDEGSLTVEALTQAYLDRIAAVDHNGPSLRSVLQVNPEALDIARELDAELQAGQKRGPLHGIPVLLKDNIDTHDQMTTTAGSRALEGSKPLQDSYITAKLREAGAVILGKANLSEWANFRGELSSSGWS